MNWIKSFIVILLVSIASIKIIDLTFSFFYNQTNAVLEKGLRSVPIREWNPNQKLDLKPSYKDLAFADGLEKKVFPFSIDEKGFIKNKNRNKPVSGRENLKILFLGGSTTETMYVEPHNRFPSMVENILQNSLSKNVTTLNGGVGGNDSMNSLINLIAKGISERPHIAILMHNINDLALLSKTGSYWVAPKSRAIVISDAMLDQELNLSTVQILRNVKNILAPNLYKYLKERLFPSISFASDEFDGFRGNQMPDRDIIITQFKNSLQSFVSICKAWDIEPILMTQFNRITNDDPIFHSWADEVLSRERMSKKDFVNLYLNFNEVVRLIATENNILLIDLAKLIPQNSNYIFDLVHVNDSGSVLAAEIISENIEKLLIENNNDS